jgi:hypothetical protein
MSSEPATSTTSTTPKTATTSAPPAAAEPLGDRPEPGFGWNRYAERMNGRFAMIGFVSVLILEALTGQGLLTWMGLR